jgi:hypothetical protein
VPYLFTVRFFIFHISIFKIIFGNNAQ